MTQELQSEVTDMPESAPSASPQINIDTIHLHPVVEKMASEALRLNASDIFFCPDFPPAWKISGKMQPAPTKPLGKEDSAKIVLSTMSRAQQQKFVEELELNYSIVAKNGVRFRINAYHEQGRMGMVLRRINTEIPTVDDLHLPPILNQLIMKSRGMIILAGPTGSGKSTSLAAMLDYRNNHAANHILTIEDPIEYVHKPKKSIVTHREVGVDTHSWENAIQSALREAPDVVCIGEVRSAESMDYALKLAQTGHLCCCTLHASTANQTIERIMNFYPEEQHEQVLMDLGLNLVCIVGQRLAVLKENRGRRAIIDLLINTTTVQDYIIKGQLMEIKTIMTKGKNDGMQTFDQNLFQLYCDGEITFDEALRQADSANDLRLQIQLHESGNQAGTMVNDSMSNLGLV